MKLARISFKIDSQKNAKLDSIKICKFGIEILKKGINQLLYINPVVEGIYIGGSGFLTSGNGKKIRKILKEEYHDIKIKCETDIHNVIASCTDEKQCIAVICGTGSSVFSYNDGSLTKFGGWGYLIDRKGSGFNIGISQL